MTTQVVIYCRVSTQRQADSGLGLEAQEQDCRAYAAREGWQVTEVHRDAGVSGSTPVGDREGLLGALAALDKNMVLLVASRDRLARDAVMVGVLLERLTRQRGVDVVSVKGEGLGVYTDPAQRAQAKLLGTIIDAVAEFERALAGIRTAAAKRAAAARGEFLGGRVPYGMRRRPDGSGLLEPCPEEQEAAKVAVEELRAQMAAGKFPLRPIGRVLTSKGYLPRRRSDGSQPPKWTVGSIRAVLKAGGVDYDKERRLWLERQK